MESVSLNGEKYIKASKIAKELGYTSDYVGQLCREGHVECERVGRGWFVSEKSIRDHKKNRYRSTTKKSKDELEEAKEEQREKQSQSGFSRNGGSSSISYEPDESDLVPNPTPQKQAIDDQVEEDDESEEDSYDFDDKEEEDKEAPEPKEIEDTEDQEDEKKEAEETEETESEESPEYQTVSISRQNVAKSASSTAKKPTLGSQKGNFTHVYERNERVKTDIERKSKPRPVLASISGLILGLVVSAGVSGLLLATHSYISAGSDFVTSAYQVDFENAYKYYKNRSF